MELFYCNNSYLSINGKCNGKILVAYKVYNFLFCETTVITD